MKKLIFLCIAVAVVIFSVIVLNISPVIHIIGDYKYHESCKKYSDKYKYDKDKKVSDLSGVSTDDEKKEYLDLLKEGENKCKKNKAIIGLEYAAFNINIVFGFTSVILGLLYYLGVGNNLGKIIGLIGLGAGVIGFVLTLIYVIYSGIIFNNDIVGKSFNDYGYEYSEAEVRIDSDGAYLEWDDDKKSYVCIFYDKDNKDSLFLKYSDYGNKYLSYKTDVANAIDEKNFKYQSGLGCINTNLITFEIPNDPSYTGPSYPSYFSTDTSYEMKNFWKNCKKLDEKDLKISDNSEKIKYYDEEGTEKGKCDKLFYIPDTVPSNEKKDQYDKWVTSIVLSCFIFVFDLGLAIFGFLLFKDSNGSTPGQVTIN